MGCIYIYFVVLSTAQSASQYSNSHSPIHTHIHTALSYIALFLSHSYTAGRTVRVKFRVNCLPRTHGDIMGLHVGPQTHHDSPEKYNTHSLFSYKEG